MKVVTVATKSDKYFPVLISSCKKYGYDITVLGWGQKWGGFTWRFQLLLEFLKKLQPFEIVCFVDAYDVIMLQDASIMEARFKASKKNIVFAFDNCKDIYIEKQNVDMFGKCRGKRLNAGTYIGYAGHIIKMINSMCALYDCKGRYANDQINLTKFCHMNTDIDIDVSRDFFLILNEGFDTDIIPEKYDINIKKQKLVYGGSATPCILHAPGQTNINRIVKAMGFDFEVTFNSRIKWEYSISPYLPGIVQYYIPNMIIFTVALALLIFYNLKKC